MARYTDDSRDRVREAVDFADLVSARTDLRRAGATELQGLCPFHDERTPSFGINPVKKAYHCFGCGASGDVFTFVMETEGVDFGRALELLADRYDVALEREHEDPEAAARRQRRERLFALLERAAAFYARVLWESPEAEEARRYLADRGLGEEVLRAYRVGYAPSGWDRILLASRRAGFTEAELLDAGLVVRSSKNPGRVYDRFRRRIAFPLVDARGRVLGFGARALGADQQPKYVNSSDGPVYRKGRELFGLHLARAEAARAGSMLVVEGYTDVLALHQAGMRNAVAIMGTSLTEEQVVELARAAPRVELALDADAAGQEAMVRAATMARGRNLDLRVVPMPPGDDPADLIAREGADAMRERVGRAVAFPRFQVERVLDAGDLHSPGGRDRVLDELRPLLAALPRNAAFQELLRLVAGRLELSESLVAGLAESGGAPAPARRPGAPAFASAARPAPERPAVPGEGARGVLERRERTERTFLALCIALPEPGRDALRRVRLEDHFTSGLLRRAAAHLREHLAAPLADLPTDDPELTALIAELTVRAGREPASAETLRFETLQLEKERLEREMAAAMAGGRFEITPRLAAERDELKQEIDRAMDGIRRLG